MRRAYIAEVVTMTGSWWGSVGCWTLTLGWHDFGRDNEWDRDWDLFTWGRWPMVDDNIDVDRSLTLGRFWHLAGWRYVDSFSFSSGWRGLIRDDHVLASESYLFRVCWDGELVAACFTYGCWLLVDIYWKCNWPWLLGNILMTCWRWIRVDDDSM